MLLHKVMYSLNWSSETYLANMYSGVVLSAAAKEGGHPGTFSILHLTYYVLEHAKSFFWHTEKHATRVQLQSCYLFDS